MLLKVHRYILLLVVGLMLWCATEAKPMVTANVLHRTFPLRWHHSYGTAFTIDYKEKQYLITARHVVEGIRTGDSIEIFHGESWKLLQIRLVGLGEGSADVAVLESPIRLSPPLALPASSKGLVLAQQVYFLGYPFGWDGGHEDINRGFPLAIVKSGFVSAMPRGRFIIDAHVNEGFSGGPLLFVPPRNPANRLRVVGIIVGYPVPRKLLPVVDQSGNKILDQDGRPIGIADNPGFVIAVDIFEAVRLIEAHSIEGSQSVPANQ